MSTVIGNFKPSIWSRELLYTLKKALVGNSIVNRNYQGEITREGDTVRIQTPSSITTGDYSTGQASSISFQDLTASTQSLSINKAKYFAFLVDDVDQAQANVPLMQSFMQEAAYSLADAADTLIFREVLNAHADNVMTPTKYDATTIYAGIVGAKKNLSKKNVPSIGRWIVLSPEEIALLEASTQFASASDLGDEIKRTGFAGRIAGLEVFESNQIIESGYNRLCPYGYTGAITFADQIVSTESGRREAGFSDYVKGLHVYGLKTVRPTGLGSFRILLAS